jgi:MoaA/NifB/PqqE/SkfB family radical SAM enzyme
MDLFTILVVDKYVMNNSTTICSIPWNHLAIYHNGDYRICCQINVQGYGRLITEKNALNIQTCSIDEARNHPKLKELRKAMLNNEQHPMCEVCYSAERFKLGNKRSYLSTQHDYGSLEADSDGAIDVKKYPLTYADIRFGNLCNLKCRSCGPSDSSAWIEDVTKLYQQKKIWYYDGTYDLKLKAGFEDKYEIDSTDFTWYEQPECWERLVEQIPNINRYYFTGGEPFINKTHFRLLEKIIELGYSKNVKLEYNSNMVAFPEKLLDLWSNFNHVMIGCSVDGINEMTYYLRYPGKWSSIEENLSKMVHSPNIYLSFSITVSVYNVRHLLDITRWLIERDLPHLNQIPAHHVLIHPPFMSTQVLPREIKEEITADYEMFYREIAEKYSVKLADHVRKSFSGIISFMNAKDTSFELPLLKGRTAELDALRGQSVSDTIPWLGKILDKV